MQAILVIEKLAGIRREFKLTKPRNVVGRNKECDLRIPLNSVSRRHCELLIKDGQLTVHDLESDAGTLVNSNPIQRTVLQPGDRLAIGPITFLVHALTPTAKSPDPATPPGLGEPATTSP